MAFTVSVNPSYFCNFSCDFCYLTESQLRDTKKISLERLDELLGQIPAIDYVDLYGGEIGALKKDYFFGLKDTIRKHYSDEINIITNYSMLHDGFYEDDVYLSVSYDFEAREKSELVYKNMLLSPVPIAVLILASPGVIRKDIDEMIEILNMCSSIESVEIKPYSANQANNLGVTHKEFENFIIGWMTAKTPKNFKFINANKIKEAYDGYYNAFSDNHIYITPSGNFGVLEFDAKNQEYFLELPTWNDYLAWTQKEKADLSPICKECRYYGTCLTEHYQYVNDLTNSCNGYKGLLDWHEGMESKTGSISSTQS